MTATYITVDTISDSAIQRIYNSPNALAPENVDATVLYTNYANLRTPINDLIAQAIELDENTVFITTAQDIAGVKTFEDSPVFEAGIDFSSGEGVNDDNFNIGVGLAAGDRAIRLHRIADGTSYASVQWDESDAEFLLYTTGTTLAKIQIAAGTSANHAVRYDQTGKLATINTWTQINTFNELPTLDTYEAPTTDAQFAPKKYVDDQTASLVTGGIIQQASAPAVTNNNLWIDTDDYIFWRANGSAFGQVVWSVNPLTDIDLTGAPPASTTDSLLGLGIDIASGSAAGTFLGINKASFTGDFINAQVNGVSKFLVTSSGGFTAAGNGTVTGTLLVTGVLTHTASAVFSGGFSVTAGQTIDFNANRLQDVGDPSSAQDAMTLAYYQANLPTEVIDVYGGATTVDASTVLTLSTTRVNSAGGVYALASNKVTISQTGTYLFLYKATAENIAFAVALQEDTGGGMSTVANSTVSVSGDSAGTARLAATGCLAKAVTSGYAYQLLGTEDATGTASVTGELIIIRLK